MFKLKHILYLFVDHKNQRFNTKQQVKFVYLSTSTLALIISK